jgi:hypothetical protein
MVGVDLSGEEPIYINNYIYINESCAPRVVPEENVPEEYRFNNLNQCLLIEDNSEQYHNEIKNQYKSYSKANRINVVKNILRHPRFGVSVLSDFIKRRFVH